MKSAEEACCVVTVFENSKERANIAQPFRSGQTPGRPANRRLSSSGVIVNDHTGIVLCSGLLFSHFLIDKESVSSDYQFLLPHSISDQLSIYVQCSGQQRLTTSGCSVDPVSFEAMPMRNVTHFESQLIMMVNCLEFRSTFRKVFKDVDKWSFYSGEEDAEPAQNIQFLSWFAVLRVPGLAKSEQGRTVPWVHGQSLEKGCVVFACGSPFGTFCPDLFMSTLSKGIVSNLAGEDHALILTDARCLPGTEGGGLFVKSGDLAYLVGLIVSPLCWKSNEWIGLTLVCSLQLILRNILKSVTLQDPTKEVCAWLPGASIDSVADADQSMKRHPSVALVDTGQFWGSGILMSSRLMLTCRHVLHGQSRLTVRFKTKSRFLAVMGEVLYSTKVTSPYDVAVVLLKEQLPDVEVPTLASTFTPGEDVYVIGYGAFGQSCGPTVTSGILSRAVAFHSQPVMLQTTCAVQAGSSGGAVIRAQTGELLGLVASNTRDMVAGVTYPHLNFSIPASLLDPLLQQFSRTGDPAVFRQLDSADEQVRRAWRLQAPPLDPLKSKL
ncbi:peroxisomal leader peptide-processing protease [Anguilla rostrata]|uniref:peroxisomal leader peptide-processing protease n=1 Tax=Anguilla rostrata TaxID=7938 RepID=UPI0030D353F3